jgi:nucleotide-binding universal stress UspA family protein
MFEDIIVPLDGSTVSVAALDHAVDLARKLGSNLILLNVVPDPPMPIAMDGVWPVMDLERTARELRAEGELILERGLERVRERGLDNARRVLKPADAHRIGDVIVAAARDEGAELIVIGTHGRSGLDRMLLGSVAERVAHRASMPVMLIHAPAK